MAKKLVAVLDVGSREVNAYAGEKTDTGYFSIRASTEAKYAGYKNGLFVDENSLASAVSDCIGKLSRQTGADFVRVYAGVPAEFSLVRTRELRKDFSSPQKIDGEIIDKIIEEGDAFDGKNGFVTVASNALYFTLDDDRMLSEARGKVASSITIFASYTLAEKEYTETIGAMLRKIGCGQVSFISTPYAEAVGILSADERERTLLFADVGHRSTSLMLVRGGGLSDLASFSLGRESFVADLAGSLKITPDEAEKLLKQLNLNIPAKQGDVLLVNRDLGFYTQDVAEIVSVRIENFAVMFQKSLDKFKYQCPMHMVLYLTGEGILSIRGAKGVLERYLGRKIDALAPDTPNYDTPKYSAAMGLVGEALKNETQPKNGVLNKLFGKR